MIMVLCAFRRLLSSLNHINGFSYRIHRTSLTRYAKSWRTWFLASAPLPFNKHIMNINNTLFRT